MLFCCFFSGRNKSVGLPDWKRILFVWWQKDTRGHGADKHTGCLNLKHRKTHLHHQLLAQLFGCVGVHIQICLFSDRRGDHRCLGFTHYLREKCFLYKSELNSSVLPKSQLLGFCKFYYIIRLVLVLCNFGKYFLYEVTAIKGHCLNHFALDCKNAVFW